jgi:hypothetical protein
MELGWPYFDRFDIVSAHYWWYADHHSGQWSPEYERLSRISEYYRPGRLEVGPVTENARAIYDRLCDLDNCDHERLVGE